MKQITIGILAHVDAGKTTCIESILFNAGKLKKTGRVDHQDAFLDYDTQERDRGITIYSKQAYYTTEKAMVTIIDTPGHIDFSSEMERTLQVLDLAILLINGQDGVQAHTRTIWECLKHYHIPTILFINKMDISFLEKGILLADLHKQCSEFAIDMTQEDKEEQISLASENLLNEFLESGSLSSTSLQEAFQNRLFFPVLFGSALKNEGIQELMDAIEMYSIDKKYPNEFGAKVFKITKDDQGNRLTHIKITSGKLYPKQKVGDDEKVDQIRLYNGQTYTLLNEALPGMVVSIKGLKSFTIGQGLGIQKDTPAFMLNAYLSYRLLLPHDKKPLEMMDLLDQLVKEDPSLQIEFNEQNQQISLRLMGDIQLEVLQRRIYELSGIKVGFGLDRVLYKETIADSVIGKGHFEPLRHYAEVHLRLDPLPRGKGLLFDSEAKSDELALNWQRLILSHLQERKHRGVLTGSEITDMKITLVAGKSHLKHTEGGDFRQATYRAVRQGLKKATSILLEPYYQFELIVPNDRLSKALYELESKEAQFEVKEGNDDEMCIVGKGPVRTMMNFQSEVIAFTKGLGRFSCALDGYYPCTNQDALVQEIGYDSEKDLKNPTGSVFCSQGSGYYVPWDEADEYMHIQPKNENSSSYSSRKYTVNEEDLKKVFDSLGGRNKNMDKIDKKPKKKKKVDMDEKKANIQPKKEECLIIDGYNLLYAWNTLKEIAKESIESARDELISYVSNYQGYRNIKVLLVFDGHHQPYNQGSSFRHGGLDVVYTRTGQSADQYIERKVYELKNKYSLTVATSDGLIQNSILANGAKRMSGIELISKLKNVNSDALNSIK